MTDPFLDATGNPRIVRGVNIASNSTRIAELAGTLGFDTVWIEVEHGTPGYTEVEALCTAVEAGGAIPTVRVQDHRRTHVLRALEAGARILVVPMVNTREEARQVVEHGKFPPLGNRGFNMSSRGVRYGVEPIVEAFQKANDSIHLFAQVESMEAVANLEAICTVKGLAGIFIGPGDLSISMGKPGRLTDPEVIQTAADCIQCARELGKHAGIMAAPGPLLEGARKAGADLVIYGSDLSVLIGGWRALLESEAGR